MTAEREALTELENEYPGWHCWQGVGGDTFYARRERSSPPVVKRAQSITELRKQIEQHLTGQEGNPQ